MNSTTIKLNRGRKEVYAVITPKADGLFDLLIAQATGKVRILSNLAGLTQAQVDAAIAE